MFFLAVWHLLFKKKDKDKEKGGGGSESAPGSNGKGPRHSRSKTVAGQNAMVKLKSTRADRGRQVAGKNEKQLTTAGEKIK